LNYDAIEALLVERNDPLINLGLACYGTNEEVFKALYKHGLAKPTDAVDERYKRGLRIGCLSNRAVPAANFDFDFPRQLIGSEEIHRVLAAGDDGEVEALISNPSVSDKLLQELYERKGAFATLPEDRWRNLIYLSRKNERLVSEKDYGDVEHWKIQDAIFRLLETAPIHYRWLVVLYGLLDQLDFQHVSHPETIDAVLSRWAKLDVNTDGKLIEGYFTSLSLKDEFRSLIAALYGRTWSNNKSAVQGILWEVPGKQLGSAAEARAGLPRPAFPAFLPGAGPIRVSAATLGGKLGKDPGWKPAFLDYSGILCRGIVERVCHVGSDTGASCRGGAVGTVRRPRAGSGQSNLHPARPLAEVRCSRCDAER
jgi:hypothetical protein